MGWYHFDVVETPPNTIDDLTNEQLLVIAGQYNNDVKKFLAFQNVVQDAAFAGVQNVKYHVDWVYAFFNRVQRMSASLMREEVIVDSNGPVYNTKPVDRDDLSSQLDGMGDDDWDSLAAGQKTYALSQMISHSKLDNTGDWAYYSSQF